MSIPPSEKSMSRRQAGYLIVGAIIVVAGTIALAVWMLFDAHRDAWNEAVRASTNLTTAFERDISRNIDLYDLSLKSAIANRGLPNLWSFDPELRNRILFGGASAPYLGAMRLLDANGRMVAESGWKTPPDVNFSDRDYFQVHRDRRDVGLYISAPLKGRETGEWMVAFSRRIENADGAFAGIAVGTMRLAYFQQLFDSVDVGPDSTIALLRGDGTFAVRKPSGEQFIGHAADGGDKARIFSGWSQGAYEAVSSIDGVLRLNAYRQIGDRPLAVAVGLSEQAIFADWQQKAITVAFSVAALVLMAGTFGALFTTELWRRTQAERLVAASEQHLRQSQQMEAVGRLAGGIAHDFNNILSSILGFAGFLVQDLPAGSAERTFAERIVRAAERAKGLAHQILSFSRRSGVERVPLNLASIVLETRDLLRATLPASTRLEVTVKTDSLVIEANAAQMSQILLNLCVNANDALLGQEGTVSLSVARLDSNDADRALFAGGEVASNVRRSAAEGRVLSGSLEPDQSHAVLTVADTGVGMAPDVLQHIFDPFFTTKERGRGTGLGLSVVHGIVLEYGGACMVTSTPGGGSVFNVYLALSDGAVAPEAPAVAHRRGRERILVVDDEADVAETLTIGLERLGYEVVTMTDPETALEAFAQNPAAWDIVISDQVMPRLKGLALFARLKAMRSSLRFILCTGFSDGASEEAALAQGVDAYFLKPVPIDHIAAAIRRLIDEPAARSRVP